MITAAQVADFARLALQSIGREFPYKPGYVLTGPESLVLPRKHHPVFYGCFDWHSAVHGHWMLARLLRRFPEHAVAPEIRSALNERLRVDELQAEADFFSSAGGHGFERPYGWAWALRLAAETHGWDDADAQRWNVALAPLAEQIEQLTRNYLARLQYPVRSGVHSDTAFALGQMLDYCAIVGRSDLRSEIGAYCREKYLQDRGYCASFEPSGEDFFSPSLNEADLMRRLLGLQEFQPWLDGFLPGLADPDSSNARLFTPVEVADVNDGRLVHLAGLNLSRAWALRGIARALPHHDPRQPQLAAAIASHQEAGLRYVCSGSYEGEHWLATFAVYLLTPEN
ncbi:MAG: DUF2891 domain-containing protein [Planctomycetales bacterium]|nr:DUF2891 domain-containing protein [Planctomycetales bacterium]